MSKAAYTLDEVRFDVRDEKLTKVYAFVTAKGDCPHNFQGWHHRTFLSSMTVQEIVNVHLMDFICWPLQAPKE